MATDQRIGGILLAAGASTRLGRPKQLIEYRGKPLIRHAAEVLSQTECCSSIAVLGSNANLIAPHLDGVAISSSFNPDWAAGIGSSIRTGVQVLLDRGPELDGILIILCDQPLVSAGDLGRLIREFRGSGKPIAAAEYQRVTGVPAVFGKELFALLVELDGDKGARSIIRRNPSDVVAVAMPSAAFDVDTAEDERRLTA